MKRNPIKVEVYKLNGEKVYISKDSTKMDLSGLANDNYIINYIDTNGFIFYRERIKISQEEELIISVD